LDLTLVQSAELDLEDQEKALLAKGTLVMRQDYMQFISSIDGSPQLLSIKLPFNDALHTCRVRNACRLNRHRAAFLGAAALTRPGKTASGRRALR
jgi:hypothetical protein